MSNASSPTQSPCNISQWVKMFSTLCPKTLQWWRSVTAIKVLCQHLRGILKCNWQYQFFYHLIKKNKHLNFPEMQHCHVWRFFGSSQLKRSEDCRWTLELVTIANSSIFTHILSVCTVLAKKTVKYSKCICKDRRLEPMVQKRAFCQYVGPFKLSKTFVSFCWHTVHQFSNCLFVALVLLFVGNNFLKCSWHKKLIWTC